MPLEKLAEKQALDSCLHHSWAHVATYTTETDFADDLSLISDYLKEAHLLSLRLEVAAETVGLHVNYSTWKRNSMLYNQAEGDLVTLEGNKLKQVDNFKYLGSWIQSSEKDMNIRIGQAWSVLKKMMKVWKKPTKPYQSRFLSGHSWKCTASWC